MKAQELRELSVEELAGKEFSAGRHTLEFNSGSLAKGIYFYTLKAGSMIRSQKMIIQDI